jgi:hypothetical protein
VLVDTYSQRRGTGDNHISARLLDRAIREDDGHRSCVAPGGQAQTAAAYTRLASTPYVEGLCRSDRAANPDIAKSPPAIGHGPFYPAAGYPSPLRSCA